MRKNEAIIWNEKKYIYTGCNRENAIEDQENIDGHESSKKEEGQEGKGNEENTEMNEERNTDDETSSGIEFLEIDEVIKQGLSHLFPDVIAHVNKKKEVIKEGQEAKGNERNNTEMTDRKNNIGDDISSDEEILNSDEVIKRGSSSVFVPARTYLSDSDDMPASDYRGRVLEILKKPYDKKEYRELSEELKIYLANYPDLRKELAKHRYKKPVRINLMRGFFYWLKNMQHAGKFKPWQDSECLAVQPESGQGN